MMPRTESCWTRPQLTLGMVLCLLWLTIAPVAGATDPSGRVLDPNGKGVPGAQVWAIGRTWETPGVSAQGTTDAEGHFALPGAWKLGELNLRYLSVFARARDGRCGWIATVWRNQPGGDDLAIELGEVGEVSGRIIDQTGKPITGCVLKVDSLDRSPGKPGVFDAIRIAAQVSKNDSATTDADGRFVLKGIPKGARIQVELRGDGLGEQEVAWMSTTPVTITLDRRLGSLTGRFTLPDARGISGSVKLALQSELPRGNKTLPPLRIHVSRTITVGTSGSFQFAGLPPGAYSLMPEFGPDAPFSASPTSPIDLKPGDSISNVEIPLKRIALITGRIIDQQTGQGIAGVSVRSYNVRGHSLFPGQWTKTDSAGATR